MLRKEEKCSGFSVQFFNPNNSVDRDALHEIIAAEIAVMAEDNKLRAETNAKMVEWLKSYTNSSEFLTTNYPDPHSIELVAEATFWTVKLGLGAYLSKMSYAEVRQYHPLTERFLEETERSKLIDEVCNKLVKPSVSLEASYALGQAAHCVLVHTLSYSKYLEEEKLYEAKGVKPGF